MDYRQFVCTLALMIVVLHGADGAEPMKNVLEQSRPCTPEDNLKQIQCLRELPAERYEVLAGEDVQMRCRVAHQRGKAQWRAGNFLLGHTRSIPGWKRYSLQGDPRLGIHDLVIQNVTNEDAGTFECQVSPADGHGPLRRQTTLAILTKPDPPVIVTPAGEPQPLADGQLIVPMTHATDTPEQLCLICQSTGGTPAPTFEWFHNGRPVPEQHTASQPQQQQQTAAHQEQNSRHVGSVFVAGNRTESSSSSEHRSELVLNKSELKTGDRVVCLVSNKATLRSSKLSQQKLRSELLIVIHVAPGDPEIIDWAHKPNRSAIFDTGATLDATCRSVPAGTPPGELLWRLEKNAASATLGNLETGSTYVTTISAEHVVYQYTEEKLLSKVSIPRINSTYHGLQLVCVVKHPVGPERTTSVSILVRHGPAHVYIDGPSDTIAKLKSSMHTRLDMFNRNELPIPSHNRADLTYVYRDRPQYLLCLTSPYFDQASVKWFGYLNITGRWEELPSLQAYSLSLETVARNFIHASFVQLVSTNAEHSLLTWTAIKCVSEPVVGHEGEGITRGTAVRRLELKPYEPPGQPTIKGHDLANLVPVGTNVTLRCEAYGGSPAGQLLWISDAHPNSSLAYVLRSAATLQEEKNRIWSTVRVTMEKEYNGINIKCGSENAGYKLSDSQFSTPLRFNVAYGATSINLSVTDESGRKLYPSHNRGPVDVVAKDQLIFSNTSPQLKTISVDAGTTISVACQVDMSNPPLRILYRLHHCISKVDANYSEAAQPQSDKMCKKHLLGDTGNTVEPGHVQLRLNWSHHGSRLECFTQPVSDYRVHETMESATDAASQSTHGRRTLSERVLLNVRFVPMFVRQAERLNWPGGQDPGESGAEKSLPHHIASEGGSVYLDLEPYANPAVEKYMWIKNHERLISGHGSTDRITLEGPRLQIRPVHVEDMGNYTLFATNEMGTNAFGFFLNVTYGPRLIGPIVVNMTASGNKAHLECEAIANPAPIENAVRWRRLAHRSTDTNPWSIIHGQLQTGNISFTEKEEQTDTVSGIRCHKGKWHSDFKYFAKCWSPKQGVLASSLTIYDLNPADVGRYECYMDNAIGSPAVKYVDLIYPFSPQIYAIQRWAKAAPNWVLNPSDHTPFEVLSNGTEQDPIQARLTCVIAAEPAPVVKWIREPANLTLHDGGQYKMEVKNIHPGLYKAILIINQPKATDLGRYFCKAINNVGAGSGLVELVEPSRPDPPNIPYLLNATSTSLTVAWTQAYSGGPKQTYQLRWAPNDTPENYKQSEIPEDLDSEVVMYTIRGLQKATTYRVSVNAGNKLFGFSSFTPYIIASTKAQDPIPDSEAMRDEARVKSLFGMGGRYWKSVSDNGDSSGDGDGSAPVEGRDAGTASSIIASASVFGCIVLVVNLLVILILARRRRAKLRKQRTTTLMSPGSGRMKLRSTGPSYTDMGGFPNVYTGYPDGGSLTGEVLVQSRSADQFTPFMSDLGQMTVNMSPTEQLNYMNQPYTGSPHPSLQAVNPLLLPSSDHYNTSAVASHLTDSAFTALPYSNRETGMPHQMEIQPTHPLCFEEQQQFADILRGSQSNSLVERRTPINIRQNLASGIQPSVYHVDGPQSGPSSCISAPWSVNAYSLERNPHHLWARTPSIPRGGHPMVRQSSFGYSVPNGNMRPNPVDFGSCYNQASASASNSTTNPNQVAMVNYRNRSNAMTASYCAERRINPSYTYMDNFGNDDTILSNPAIVRKGSFNKYKYHDAIMPTENAQMNQVYLQRYNEQLQSVREMNQRLAASNFENEFDKLTGIHSLSPNGTAHASDILVIPPPNAFGTNGNRQLTPHSQRSTQIGQETVPGLDFGATKVADSYPDEEFGSANNQGSYKEVKFASVAPVKRPSPMHVLLNSNEDRNPMTEFGSMV